MNGANLSLPEPIELVAIDPARNIRRRYSITASLDLFGMIVVETRWGRIGSHGQAQRHAFIDRAAADRHIAATLRRRVENRTNTVARQFDRVCDVLTSLGYLTADGDDAQVTTEGAHLRRLYSELDLVAALAADQPGGVAERTLAQGGLLGDDSAHEVLLLIFPGRLSHRAGCSTVSTNRWRRWSAGCGRPGGRRIVAVAGTSTGRSLSPS